MKTIALLVGVLSIYFLPTISFGQEKLPRILILGDSIYQQPGQAIAREYQGQIDVHTPAMKPGEIRNSATALENFDQLIGDENWDLIHFNFGLADLVYRAPGMKSFRAMAIDAGGVRATNPKAYENNLRALVKRLKATNAKLVWASTTPIRHSTSNVFLKGSEVQYNAIAAKVMAEEKVPVNDMYSFAKALINMDKPAAHGADPFFFDKKPLHPPIVDSVFQELNLSSLGASRVKEQAFQH